MRPPSSLNPYGMGDGCTILIRRFGTVMVNHQNGFVPNVKNALIVHMITATTAARRWTETMKTRMRYKYDNDHNSFYSFLVCDPVVYHVRFHRNRRIG